jgi:glycosyltransferase involved in cell wall biosynthesis
MAKQEISYDAFSSASAMQGMIGGSRILFLVDELEPITADGSERQLLQMIDISRRNGMRPQVGVFRGTRWLTDEAAGCPVTHFDFKAISVRSSLRSLMQLKRWIAAQKFDILQALSADANLLGPVAGRLAKVPVILETRKNLNCGAPDDSTQLRLRWQSRINPLASQIIANTSAVLEQIVESERVSRDRICVIYNGIDLEQMQPAPELREAAREALGIVDDQILVGHISGFKKVDGVQMFMNAAVDAHRRDPRLRFFLVGDGELKTQMQQAIRMYGLDGIVQLRRPEEDIRPYLAAFDMGVLCSSEESLSNRLLEYMACGVPVIAADAAGNREAIGSCGLLIRPEVQELADAIQTMSDHQTRKEFAAAALEKVSEFNIDIASRRMTELYAHHLAAGRSKKRTEKFIAPGAGAPVEG